MNPEVLRTANITDTCPPARFVGVDWLVKCAKPRNGWALPPIVVDPVFENLLAQALQVVSTAEERVASGIHTCIGKIAYFNIWVPLESGVAGTLCCRQEWRFTARPELHSVTGGCAARDLPPP